MRFASTFVAICFLAACSGSNDPAPTDAPPAADTTQAPDSSIIDQAAAGVDALHMYLLDCGLIEIADLDGFSSAGDYAGLTSTFADTCWLIRHPQGDLLWDLGLPSALVGNGLQENGVFTISMERTISDQLAEIGLFASEVEAISISHSHFDHAGQADQFQASRWLVHVDEYAAMFPADAAAIEVSDEESDAASVNPFLDFANLERQEFTGEHDVFGDGSVVIVPTPGHTPGHTSLLVTLPETGPVFLTGDLYHRTESRALKRVPRFNSDEAQTLVSMDTFEVRAATSGARIIIQHEMDDIADLPKSPEPIR